MYPLLGRIARSSVAGALAKQHAPLTFFPRSIPNHSKAFASVYQTPSKAAVPERLLIYHAGTGKIVFLGILKVTTIFLLCGTLLIAAPTFYYDKEQPFWVPPAVLAAGAVPFLYVTYCASPFVAYVHFRLPVFARRSREQLLKWAQNIPPNTEVEMTTIKSYGSLRSTRMQISELQPTKALFGIQNLVKIPKHPPSQKRPWWAPREQCLFFVGNERRKTIETAVWQKALGQIRDGGSQTIKIERA